MPRAPLVSVILPTYNRASLVGRAIRSVLAQTLSQWELVVVDDGSTDDTEAVVAALAEPRIVYVRREENEGVAAARNAGIDIACGLYVSFLDSDDEYLPAKLERQWELLRRCEDHVGAVECGMRLLTRESERILPPALKGRGFEEFLLFEEGVNLATLLMKRALAATLRFDEALPPREDSDFLLRLLRYSRLAFVDEPLVVIHQPEGPRLATAANLKRGLEGLIRKYEDELKERPRVRASWHHKLAFFHIQRRDILGARRALLEAIKARPWNLTRWFLLGAAMLGNGPFFAIHRVYVRMGRIRQRLRTLAVR